MAFARVPANDPPEISARFNARSHEERRIAGEHQRQKEYTETVKRRREILLDASAQKRVEKNELATVEWSEHRKAVRRFRQARAYEAHLDACVGARVDWRRQQGMEKVRTAAEGGIQAFEANLSRMTAEPAAYNERLRQMTGDQEYELRLVHRREEEKRSSEDRARRRQQVMIEQQKGYGTYYEVQRKQQLMRKVTRASADENVLHEELRTQVQWRQVMINNRRFREKQYEERQVADHDLKCAAQVEQRQREMRECERDKKVEQGLVQKLAAEKEEAKAKKRATMCRDIVDGVFRVACKSIDYRARTDEAETVPVSFDSFLTQLASSADVPREPFLAPAPLWSEWMVQFVTSHDHEEPAETLPGLPPLSSPVPLTAPPEADEPPPPAEEEAEVPEVPHDPALAAICESQVMEYVNHAGQWAGGPGKAPGGSVFNTKLCRLVKDMRAVKYPTRDPFRRKDTSPNSFALVVFSGKPLCGKNEAARHVAEKLHFKFATVTDIVTQALTFRQEHLLDLAKALSGYTPEQEELLRERVALAREAQVSQLNEGNVISDGVLVDLVLNYHRFLRVRAHAAAKAGVHPGSDPPRMHAPPSTPAPGDAVRGLILSGFPVTAAQFQVLEERLTTYDASKLLKQPELLLAPPQPPSAEDDDEEPPTPLVLPAEPTAAPASPPPGPPAKGKRQSLAAAPAAPAEAAIPTEPEPEMPPLTEEETAIVNNVKTVDVSGVDLVINFECGDNEVLARYSGQRTDPETGVVYHLQYHPPPDEALARLEKVQRSQLERTLLDTKLSKHKHHSKRLLSWLKGSGVELVHVNAEGDLSTLRKECCDLVEQAVGVCDDEGRIQIEREEIVARREVVAEEMPLSFEIRKNARAAKKIIEEDEARAALIAAAQAAGGKQAANIPPPPQATPAPVPVPPPVILPVAVTPEMADGVLEQVDKMADFYTEGLRKVFLEFRSLRKQSVEHFVGLSQQFREFLERPDSKQQMVEKFQEEFNSFDSELRWDEDGLAELHLRAEFLQTELLKELERKRSEANDQIRAYEREEWLDLWKKAAAVQFRELLLLECGRFASTRDTARFHFLQRYLRDAPPPPEPAPVDPAPKDPDADGPPQKGKKDAKKPTPPAQKGRAKEAAAEQEGERPDEFQIAYKAALEWLEKPDASQEEPPKEAAKPGGKRKVSATPEPLDKGVGEAAEKQAKKVWAQEAELLKFRLNALCTKYYDFTEEVGLKGRAVYSRMANWLTSRHDKEMTAVSQLVRTIREAIEEQEPLRAKILLQGDTLSFDTEQLLIPPEEVPVLPSEPSSDDADLVCLWVTKGQMRRIISDFSKRAPRGLCDRATFVRIWLCVCAQAAEQGTAVPQWWSELDRTAFEAAFDGFDWLEQGMVDWRQFCTALLLWSDARHDSPFCISTPSLQALVDLRDSMFEAAHGSAEDAQSPVSDTATGRSRSQDGDADTPVSVHLDQEGFMGCPFWFETNGDVSEVRAEQIKGLLWQLFAQDAPEAPAAPPSEVAAGDEVEVREEPKKSGKVVHWPRFLLYLCADSQIVRGAQKGFSILTHSSLDGRLSNADVFELFHFSPYTAALQDGSEDPCSTEAIDMAFNQERARLLRDGEELPEDQTIQLGFPELCGSHSGRLLLNSGHVFLIRRPAFENKVVPPVPPSKPSPASP
eukprot:Hpha_TRINITY_DN15541_c5_g6::TRINITY_DN15541_c5_g6_i1::g.109125::m.109125